VNGGLVFVRPTAASACIFLRLAHVLLAASDPLAVEGLSDVDESLHETVDAADAMLTNLLWKPSYDGYTATGASKRILAAESFTNVRSAFRLQKGKQPLLFIWKRPDFAGRPWREWKSAACAGDADGGASRALEPSCMPAVVALDSGASLQLALPAFDACFQSGGGAAGDCALLEQLEAQLRAQHDAA